MLTNDWKMKRESGYVKEILEWRNDEKKRDEMEFLKILFKNVYGMEIKRKRYDSVYTRRRMVEVWKDEGKEDSEGRREWERRWREVGDIMNEEDVMEISIMHLCIPDYEEKEKNGLIVLSLSSVNALRILLNEKSFTCHFPGYDINDQPSNVVIIRNLPSGFDLESRDGDELKSMIENVCPIISIDQAVSEDSNIEYGAVKVTLNNSDDALAVATELDGQLFHNVRLRVSHKDNGQMHHTLLHTSITPPAGDVQPYDCNAENERETDVKLDHPLKQPIRSYCDTGGESVWKVEGDESDSKLTGYGVNIKSESESREMRLSYMSNGVIELNGTTVLVDSREIDEGEDVYGGVERSEENEWEVMWEICGERVCNMSMMNVGVEDILFVKSVSVSMNEEKIEFAYPSSDGKLPSVTPETIHHNVESALNAIKNTFRKVEQKITWVHE